MPRELRIPLPCAADGITPFTYLCALPFPGLDAGFRLTRMDELRGIMYISSLYSGRMTVSITVVFASSCPLFLPSTSIHFQKHRESHPSVVNTLALSQIPRTKHYRVKVESVYIVRSFGGEVADYSMNRVFH